MKPRNRWSVLACFIVLIAGAVAIAAEGRPTPGKLAGNWNSEDIGKAGGAAKHWRLANRNPKEQRDEQEPSNTRELAEWQTTVSAHVIKADQARKARMSPGELAWERVLEKNLGAFYLPRYKKDKADGKVTAWDYVKDDPNLPRVLLIGDSISRGYTVQVREALAGKVNVHRAPANCGSTAVGLKKLHIWLGDGKWDLIHFNFGIHDRNSKADDYAARLEQIVKRLRTTGARLVWGSSTPLSGRMLDKTKSDPMVRLNKTAAEVMKRHGIPIDDLYAVVKPTLATIQGPDGCHYRPAGYKILGQAVAKCILEQLALDRTPVARTEWAKEAH
ncbi:MAG TPA: SGNH/GDSL hydrolase family protein [Desulfobacteraceae bacterium]|nr:SGNH/GDSL hydrolase family protein [Desulfobacteraceae bacterium]